MKKIIVTGGAGMIGSSLVSALLKRNDKVIVIDNLSSSKMENLNIVKKLPTFTFIKGDVKDLNFLRKNFKNTDIVFHLAANSDIKYKDGDSTDTDLRENTIGIYNVLEAMRVNNVNQIVFSSTSAVYGESKIIPTPENYGPLEPISLYGASKLASEGLISAFSHLFGIQAWIFRFANVVTEKSRKVGTTVISDFINKLRIDNSKLEVLGNGKQKKSFLWIDDCIDGMISLINNSRDNVNIINLGTSDWITIEDIAKIVIKKMGLINAKLVYTGGERGWKGDVPFMLLDTSLAKKLGWSARYNSKEAVTKSVEGLIK